LLFLLLLPLLSPGPAQARSSPVCESPQMCSGPAWPSPGTALGPQWASSSSLADVGGRGTSPVPVLTVHCERRSWLRVARPLLPVCVLPVCQQVWVPVCGVPSAPGATGFVPAAARWLLVERALSVFRG
ncbi:hypothetical protein H1C71_003746, partial [Ictidomys tridecemlineatus]